MNGKIKMIHKLNRKGGNLYAQRDRKARTKTMYYWGIIKLPYVTAAAL